jgi:amino acid transporter
MKTNQSSKIVAGLIALFTLIAFFTMFAPAFASSAFQSANGNIFAVTFGNSDKNLPLIPLFVVAFALLITSFILSFGGLVLTSKSAMLLYVVEFVLTLAVGVIFLFAVKIFNGAHPNTSLADLSEDSLGAGSICVIVFSFISALLSLVGCYLNRSVKD